MKMKSKKGSSTKAITDAESSRAPVTAAPMTPTAAVGEAPMKVKSNSDSSAKVVTDGESSRAPVTAAPMTPTAAVGEAPMKVKSNSDSSAKATTGVKRSPGRVTKDQIRQRAYEIFLARGAAPGQDVEDWLRAESELQALQKDRDRAPTRLTTAIRG
jgi:hypothetical protein